VSIAAILDAITVHAAAAGAAVSPPITDVCVGLPWPRGRCIRVAWSGETATPKFPSRFTGESEMVGDQVVIRAFWPIGSADEAAHRGRVVEMATLAAELRDRLDGDATLGGELPDILEMGYAEPGFEQHGATVFATLDVQLELAYREVEITR